MYSSDGTGETRRNPVRASDLASVVAAIIQRDTPIDAIALTGGEPLTQSEFLADFLRAGRFPIPVLLETNGVLPHRLRDVLELVNIISMDIKPPSNTGEAAFWEEHAEFLDLSRTREVYVKVLVDQATADDDVERAAALIAPVRAATFLQPIVNAAGQPTITAARLTHLYRVARRHLETIRVLPQTNKLLGVR